MSGTPPAVGLVLPTRQGVDEELSVSAVLALAQEAEAAGAESLWVGDSLFARPRLDALTLLGAMAAVTSRCLVGTAVLITPLLHPLLLARSVATLDQITEGRLILGVGAGPATGAARKEYAAVGIPDTGRLARVREAIAVCRAVWSGEPADHHGELWNFSNVRMLPRPIAPGGPPVLLGGGGPRTRNAAGREFDGWLPIAGTPEKVAVGMADVRAGAAASGRAPGELTCTAYLTAVVDPDIERAQRTLQQSLSQYYRAPWSAVAELQDTVCGPPEVVAAAVAAYHGAGADRVIVRFGGSDVIGQWQALRAAL